MAVIYFRNKKKCFHKREMNDFKDKNEINAGACFTKNK